MFADDTNILFSHKNLPELIATLNSELSNISSWFKCNKLSLNISKTNYMHFQTAHLNPEFQYNVKSDDLSLEQKDSTNYLGVTIGKNVSWNQHLTLKGPGFFVYLKSGGGADSTSPSDLGRGATKSSEIWHVRRVSQYARADKIAMLKIKAFLNYENVC